MGNVNKLAVITYSGNSLDLVVYRKQSLGLIGSIGVGVGVSESQNNGVLLNSSGILYKQEDHSMKNNMIISNRDDTFRGFGKGYLYSSVEIKVFSHNKNLRRQFSTETGVDNQINNNKYN